MLAVQPWWAERGRVLLADREEAGLCQGSWQASPHTGMLVLLLFSRNVCVFFQPCSTLSSVLFAVKTQRNCRVLFMRRASAL